jgi:protein SSD1
VIDGKPLGAAVSSEHQAKAVEEDIKLLQAIARKLRDARFEAGALSLESLRLHFELDASGMPTDCGQYLRTEAHELIQEVRQPTFR